MLAMYSIEILQALDGFAEQRIAWLKQGLVISLIGISAVFLGLAFLFAAIKLFSIAINYQRKRTTVQQGDLIVSCKGKKPISGEVIAAIALAIHQNKEQYHDLEQTILTLNRITRPYSPWSSKIHVLRKPAR